MASDDTSGQGPPPEGVAHEPDATSPDEPTPRNKRGAHRKSRSRRFIWIRRGLITVGLVIVLVVGGVVADYYYLGSLVKRVVVHHIQPVKPGPGATENILLIGSTTRCGLKVQNKAYGLCSQGVTGVNSDIDMIVHLDPSTKTVSLLSIPRDLFIPTLAPTAPTRSTPRSTRGPASWWRPSRRTWRFRSITTWC